ncbi:MAG: RNA 2',3'-cyclic phosphodiesterase [Pyrinomonadaceae bacterium]
MTQADHNHIEANNERWRVFCAVALPDNLRDTVGQHIALLRQAMPDVRASWDRAEKLHITLKFLGEIKQSRVPSLSHAAEHAAQTIKPFELAIEGAGAFPVHGPPRVLWLGIRDSSGSLAHLQKRLEEECATENFKREQRPFHPHLTIARLRSPGGARKLAALHKETGFDAQTFAVRELLVIRSELGAGGSRYTEISKHSLGEQS